MTQQGKGYSRVRLVYKRSSTLTKVLVLFAVVLSTVTLLSLRRRSRQTPSSKTIKVNAEITPIFEACSTLGRYQKMANTEGEL